MKTTKKMWKTSKLKRTQKILTTSKIKLTLTVRSTSKTRKVAHYWKAHGTGHIKLSVFLGRALALAPISGFFRLSLLASRDFVYPSVRLVTLWVRPHLFCVSIRSFGDLVGASPPILCVRPFVWWHCLCVPILQERTCAMLRTAHDADFLRPCRIWFSANYYFYSVCKILLLLVVTASVSSIFHHVYKWGK